MGGALVSGWLDCGTIPGKLVVIEPHPGPHVAGLIARGVRVFASAEAVGTFTAEVMVLAVKPQVMDTALASLAQFVDSQSVIVSVAAGTPISHFQDLFPMVPVIRAMPNTPAAVGRGMTILSANAEVTADQRIACESLMEAVGEIAWIEDEGLMDAVTAVSGSGPAYVFLLAEALAVAGVRVGLPLDLATRLARVTIAGSGELLRLSAEDAVTLRNNVTSPGGTTEAALNVLLASDGLERLMGAAVAAATKRSRDLAS